jgi:predicted Rossmann-fold nucleotide-binding protein
MTVSTVCVYCGSSPGRNPAFAAAAATLGEVVARRGLSTAAGTSG